MGEDEFLERINLILESHKIRDGFISDCIFSPSSLRCCKIHLPFIRVINGFETDVLLVLKESCYMIRE